jgi:hypothetical protein
LLPAMLAIKSVITGTIPAINAFMERNSGTNVEQRERLNEPAIPRLNCGMQLP